MNIAILIANILTLLAIIAHIFGADKELKKIQPSADTDQWIDKQEKWTMARGAFHLVTIDFICLSILLGLINFTDLIPNEQLILKFLVFYMLLWTCAWLLVVSISKQFAKNYLKLWQWILFVIIGGLIYCGTI